MTIKNCIFRGKVNGPDYAIDFASSSGDWWRVEGCTFDFSTGGLDNAAIAARKRAPIGYVVKDNIFIGMDLYVLDMCSSTAGPPNGILCDCRAFMSAALTSVEDCEAAGHAKGLAFANFLVTDNIAQNAARVPIATAS